VLKTAVADIVNSSQNIVHQYLFSPIVFILNGKKCPQFIVYYSLLVSLVEISK